MDALFWIISSTFLVSLLGLAGALSLPLREEQLKKLIYVLTAFAVGALLGGAFFHLLPEALGELDGSTVMLYTLMGFMLFLIIEAYFHWHLGAECDVRPYSYLLLAGDAVHNFIDGLVIAGSFLVGVPFGIVTTVLIIAHEVPEELGIFGVLLHGGVKRNVAVLFSFLAQCTALVGGVAGYFLSGSVSSFSAFLISFAAGGFIYIAGTGLIPELHKEEGAKKLVSLVLILVGLVFMWAIRAFGGG